jgi:hypothetical protein
MKKNILIPPTQLIRYNFLELFIRIADRKYIKKNICNNFSEAIEMLIENYLSVYFV